MSERERVLVLACGALARELQAVLDQAGLEHVSLHCLPAQLHNTPDKITGAVADAVARFRDQYDRIYIGYADCGTGGLLDRYLEEEGLERLPGAHCYQFFSGEADFAAREDENMTAFFLTDFLARQFEAMVVKPLGLDRHPELRDMYFTHYKTLVYLAQTDDAALTEKAQDAARFLGLAFERRLTGYGDVPQALSDALMPKTTAGTTAVGTVR